MWPADSTEGRIRYFLGKCKERGLRVTTLKLSSVEAWRLRYHIYWTQDRPADKTLFGHHYKIVTGNRWTR
jgi:hypothetical protein